MKKAKRNHNKTVPFITVAGTLILSIAVIVFLSFTRNTKEIITSKAADNLGNPNFCQDSCSGFNRCDLNNPNSPPSGVDPNYNDPCCQDIAKTGDPFACPDWVKRGYCTVDQCNAIPEEGVNRQRCGAPRWHWCDLCKQNNCPEYTNTPPTQAPTNIISTPTSYIPPQPTPTAIVEISPEPTEIPEPTTPPIVPPTTIVRSPPNEPPPIITNSFSGQPRSESITQQFELPSIQLPNIQLPKIQLNFVRINQNARKPLDFFGYLFEKVVYYDKLLEDTINKKINTLTK